MRNFNSQTGKKPVLKMNLGLFFITAMVLLNTGCSIIGLAIGAASDSKKPAYKTIETSDAEPVKENSKRITTTVKPGKKITVITRDEQTITGKFKGATAENDDPALQISISDSTITVPIKNVSKIQIKNAKYGALTGFLVGAVIDGVAIVIIGNAFEESMEMNLFQ